VQKTLYRQQIKYLPVFFLLLLFVEGVSAFAELKESTTAFFFDAVCFKGADTNVGRMDVYVLVPYQTLDFIKSDDIFGAGYELSVRVLDSNRKLVSEKKTTRRLSEKDYYVAGGGSGKFDYTQTILNLPAGIFDIEVLLIDLYSNESYIRSRKLVVINFDAYNMSLSNIMIVSSIEEREGRNFITPHVSDNIGELHDGYFAFFESYNKSGADSVDLVYEIESKKGELIERSKRFRKSVRQSTTQLYLRIPYNDNFKSGVFTLRIIALKPSNNPEILKSDYLAVAERSISFFRTVSGYAVNDINKAIRQMRYVATSSEMDYIESATTDDEKLKRYVEYWKNLDPTPNTERNEAYDEYFARIDYANKNYKSYTEGWQTDKGMVYIIYGKPYNIERTSPMSDTKKYERWTYANNRQFLFVDNTGFGDFRLVSPPAVSDRFHFTVGGN